MSRKSFFSIALVIYFVFSWSDVRCEGKIINPITDVSWDCLFPITISGINVTPGHSDFAKHTQPICICPGIPPRIGLPLTFWEPVRLVDVTRHAYKLLGLGGISIGNESIKNRGSIAISGDGPSQNSFYHVHWYMYPLLSWLGFLTDFVCIDRGAFDVGYMSEFDPLWNDDQLSFIFNGEAAFFSNPLAQLACMADCGASSANKPLDSLFWCAGCEGSLYPFTGTVAHHVGAIQASHLLVERIIAKFHRSLWLKGYEAGDFCESKYLPLLKKSLYKTQLVYPISIAKGPCNALGRSSLLWGSAKSFPRRGEDFVYLVWVKRQCCLDATLGLGQN